LATEAEAYRARRAATHLDERDLGLWADRNVYRTRVIVPKAPPMSAQAGLGPRAFEDRQCFVLRGVCGPIARVT
jgi:hypothetical protein